MCCFYATTPKGNIGLRTLAAMPPSSFTRSDIANELIQVDAVPRLPVLLQAVPRAGRRFWEFLTVNIRKPNTRRAYFKAVEGFAASCEEKGLWNLSGVTPMHVAANVEQLSRTHSKPTVKQHLAAIRMRVLVHVDTELGAKDLLNNRMAYVAISRGAHDAQLFTNEREKLPVALGHEVTRESAHTPQHNQEQAVQPPQQAIAPKHEHSYGLVLGL